jgi:hypothetical protein
MDINIEGIGEVGNNMVKGKNILVHGLRVFGIMEKSFIIIINNNNLLIVY